MAGTVQRRSKIAIIGAGSVGATIAYACLIRGVGKTIALHDVDATKTRAQVLDLDQGISFVPMANVVGSDDIAVTALAFSGLPSHRVFGSGTVLDSSRLQTLIAQHCGVAVQNVHAFIAGEHGDSEFPMWSNASVGPVPLRKWSIPGRPAVDEEVQAMMADRVVGAAAEIIRGKGATSYAIGLAATRIIEAALYDEHRILPVSTMLNGSYGIEDVCLSLPTIVNRRGVDTVLTPPLAPAEVAALRRSADTVREVARSLHL